MRSVLLSSFYQSDRLDDDIFCWDIGAGLGDFFASGGVNHGQGSHAGGDCFDFVHDLHAFDDFSKNSVAVTIGAWSIEHGVVNGVDEELRGGGIRITSAGHGYGATVIFQSVFRFIGNALARGFFDEAALFRSKSTALNHEVADDAVKDSVIEVFLFDVAEEILYGNRRFFLVELDDDGTVIGFDADFRRSFGGLCGSRSFAFSGLFLSCFLAVAGK